MKRMLTLTAIVLTAAMATGLAATGATAFGSTPQAQREQEQARGTLEERAVIITAMEPTGGYSPAMLNQHDGTRITYPIYFRKNGSALSEEARRAIHAAAEEIEMGGLQQITVSANGIDASERAPRDLTRDRLFAVVSELEKAGVPDRWIGVVQPGQNNPAPGV